MATENRLDELTREIREDLERAKGEVFEDFPIQTYIDSVKSYPDYPGLSAVVREFCEKMATKYDKHTLALYQKLVLLMLIRGSIEEIRRYQLPSSVHDLCLEWFERIMGSFHARPDDYYNYTNDQFIDEMSWCSLRTIPIGGAWMVETSAVRKKHLVGGGVGQFIEFLVFILFKLGGFKPVYRIHTLKRFSGGFTPEERKKCYLRIAELLKRNTNVRGAYVCGWLYDPKLTDVSPSLAYLREIPERNGAKLFRFGITENTVRLATAFSTERKRLYEERKYTPTEYGLIWPRREMLAWAEKQVRDHETEGFDETDVFPSIRTE